MNLKVTTFNSEQLDKSIPRELINTLSDNNKIYLIPTLYWELISENIIKENHSNLNNDKELKHILEILNYLICYSFHSSKMMRKNIKDDYKRYIDFLTNIGIIHNYSKEDIEKGKSRIYYLSDTDDRFSILDLGNSEDKDKDYDDDNDVDTYVSDYKLDEFEDYVMQNCKVNIPLAIMLNHNKSKENENSGKGVYSNMIVNRLLGISRFIHNNRYYNLSDKCGRLYSSFTELTSETRKSLYMEINGEKRYFDELDMKNAAPCILSNILKVEEEIDSNMLKDASDGIFYEKLLDETVGCNPIYSYKEKRMLKFSKDSSDRKDIKIMVCASILYGSQPNRDLTTAFNNLYPEEMRLINFLKENYGKEEFANMIMRYEAKIFLNLPVPYYKFTTHDAVYFIGDKSIVENELRNRMREVFGDDKCKFGYEKNNNHLIGNIKIDVIDNTKIFIVEPSVIKHKEHKEHKNNNSLIKGLMDKGVTSTKDIMLMTGLNRSTVVRIKNKLRLDI